MTNQLRWRWFFIVLLYYPLVVSQHLTFSLWLVEPMTTPFGTVRLTELLQQAWPWLAGFSVLFLLLILRDSRMNKIWPFWLAWLLAVLLADRYLTFSVNEYMHYPQYALLAWFLLKWLDPAKSGKAYRLVLMLGTGLGVIDELLQYLVTTAHYSNYLDFNDFLTNLLATVLGVMLYYRQGVQNVPALTGTLKPVVLVVLLFAFSMLMQEVRTRPPADIPMGASVVRQTADGDFFFLERSRYSYGRWHYSAYRNRYYVLRPEEGAFLMVFLLAVFQLFPYSAQTRQS